jgi:hypothetical protein
MCNTYAFKTFDDILYADTNIVVNEKRIANRSFGGHQIFCKEGFENPFFIEFQSKTRWMRPDLVYIIENDNAVFGKDIEIKIEETRYPGIVNIEIILWNQKSKDIYEGFLNNLKQAMKNSRKGSMKVHGARALNNKFQHYPLKLLETHKEYIEKIIKNNNKNLLFILDWKYHDYDSFVSNNKKVQQDIIKQLSYEFALQQDYPNYSIESQFVIPFFYPDNYKFKGDNIGDFIEEELLIERLRDNGIRIFRANFIKIQQTYLSES